MALETFIDDRYRHRGSACVSIQPKLSRLLLYKMAYEILETHYGKDVDFVLILLDKDRPNFFWIRPSDSDAPGARKLDKTSKNTRTLSIRSLIKKLRISSEKTVIFGIIWDEEAAAARVDISEPAKNH